MTKLWLLLTWLGLNLACYSSESSNKVMAPLKARNQKSQKHLHKISMEDTSKNRGSSTNDFAIDGLATDDVFEEESLSSKTTNAHKVENALLQKDGNLVLEKVQTIPYASTKPRMRNSTTESDKIYSQNRAKLSQQLHKTISRPNNVFKETELAQNVTLNSYGHATLSRLQKLPLSRDEITSLEQTIPSQAVKVPLSTKARWSLSMIYTMSDTAHVKLKQNSFPEMLSSTTEKQVRISRRKKRTLKIAKELRCRSNRTTCQGRCLLARDFGVTTNKNRCGCDPYCEFFKDCCHDYIKYCHNGNVTNASKAAKNPEERWSCRNHIWLISSCPDTWKDHEIKTACTRNNQMTHENYADVVPVTSPGNKTFANRFCARCHGVQEDRLKWYQLDIKCSIAPSANTNLQDKIKFIFQHCKVTEQAISGMPRRYCYNTISNCSVATNPKKDILDKCIKGSHGLVVNLLTSRHYKNHFCAICNRDISVICGPSENFLSKRNHLSSVGITKSLSIIMSISDKEQTIPTFSCPEGKVYDVYSEMCRISLKVPEVAHPQLMKYRVVAWLRSDTKLNIRKASFRKETLVGYFSQAVSVKAASFSELAITLLDLHLLLVEFELKISNLNVSMQNVVSDRLVVLSDTRLNIDSFNGTIFKLTVKPLTCAATDTYLPSQYQVIPGKSSVYINVTGEVLHLKDYFSTNTTMIDGYPKPIGPIIVCRFLLPGNCSGTYISLEKEEYVMYADRSLLYSASKRTYEYKEYTIRNGSVIICTNFVKSYQNRSHDPVLTALTYGGLSISVACLIFVLATYSLFPKLRTIPGINLMNLSSALLVAHLLWLVGSGLTDDLKLCTGIAIVLHYSFLASFVWMSIIAFETWKTFSTPTLRSKSKNAISKHAVVTMVIGWLPLAVFISVCVALDQSDVITIGYGGEKGCWINNPWANLLIFAIPVVLSLTFNAVLFVKIARKYAIMRKNCKLVFSHHRCRQDCTIFTRIAASMGFTWVFGFLAQFTDIHLMYPFVFFNTLQGLFIAASFLCTRKVKQMYKELWTKNIVYAC